MKAYSDQIEKIGNQSNTPPPSPYTQESTIPIEIRWPIYPFSLIGLSKIINKKAITVVVIDSGEIVAKGTPATLKEKYAKNYLHITPKDKEKLIATLKSNNINFTVIADVYTVNVDKTEDALPIIDLVRDNIESFEVIKGTMDDAFIGITGKEIRKWKV